MRVLGGFTPGAPGNLGALLAQAQPGFTPAPGFQNFEQGVPISSDYSTDSSLDRFQELLNQLEESQRLQYRPTRQVPPLGGGFGGDLRFNTRF